MNRMNRRVGGYSCCSKNVEFLTWKHGSKAACTEIWGECKDGLKTGWKFLHRSFVSASFTMFCSARSFVPSFLSCFVKPFVLSFLSLLVFPCSRSRLRFRFVFQTSSKLVSLFHVFKQTSFLAHFSNFKRWNAFSILSVSYRLRLLRLLHLLVFSRFVRGVSCFLVLIINILAFRVFTRTNSHPFSNAQLLVFAPKFFNFTCFSHVQVLLLTSFHSKIFSSL